MLSNFYTGAVARVVMCHDNPGALEAEAELPGQDSESKSQGQKWGRRKKETQRVRDSLKDTCSCQGWTLNLALLTCWSHSASSSYFFITSPSWISCFAFCLPSVPSASFTTWLSLIVFQREVEILMFLSAIVMMKNRRSSKPTCFALLGVRTRALQKLRSSGRGEEPYLMN